MKLIIDISNEGYDWIKNGFPDNEDKEFLIKAVKNGIPYEERPQINILCENADEKAIADMKEELQKVIDDLRPQGEWSDLSTDGRHIGWIVCSVCGQEPPNESNLRTNFCPNCGADMRGTV